MSAKTLSDFSPDFNTALSAGGLKGSHIDFQKPEEVVDIFESVRVCDLNHRAGSVILDLHYRILSRIFAKHLVVVFYISYLWQWCDICPLRPLRIRNPVSRVKLLR